MRRTATRSQGVLIAAAVGAFALAGMIEVFHLLHYGLSVILIFIGVKMLASHYVKIPIGIALGAVAGVLMISILLSLVFPRKQARSGAAG